MTTTTSTTPIYGNHNESSIPTIDDMKQAMDNVRDITSTIATHIMVTTAYHEYIINMLHTIAYQTKQSIRSIAKIISVRIHIDDTMPKGIACRFFNKNGDIIKEIKSSV
jgi:hypothetical protein